MKDEDFNIRLKNIELNYNMQKQRLYEEYAKSKELFRPGDVISFLGTIILVDKVTWHKSYGMPEPVYQGLELKKDLVPKSKLPRAAIYGNDRVKFIKNGK